ncbi:MAG TPA: AtpZ/AtpI family protein [Rhizomicrobium sp.]|nr:AtpZ/AtpI family protein [Rhizomicrobium sp.]
MNDPEHRDLEKLGHKLDEVRRREQARATPAAPTTLGIAFRFTTEMVTALVVGGALGWFLDWVFGVHFLVVVFFILGAAAGIRNTMRAATELNAEMGKAPPAPAIKDEDDEER